MHSLSQIIINGSVSDVKSAVQSVSRLNFVDEYGYTPLIQTAIVNDVAKAEVLLARSDLEVDFTDLTGRNALFWAADNGNEFLCRKLLERGANVNFCTRTGQPLLVMPLLKQHSAIKKLLLNHGADLVFARDFIAAKLIGHNFELEGRCDIVGPDQIFHEVEFDGFYLKFTLGIVSDALRAFRNSFTARPLKTWLPYLDELIAILNDASELASYQDYLIKLERISLRLIKLFEKEVVILPIACSGHAFILIKIEDQLIRCDRGEYGRDYGGIIYYEVGNLQHFNPAWFCELLYKKQYLNDLNHRLGPYLNLRKQDELSIPLQVTGNCSWANVEAVIPALLYYWLKRDAVARPAELALKIYHTWRTWNRNRLLDFCTAEIAMAKPARKAALSATLAAILFQKHQELSEKWLSKLLAILTRGDVIQVLRCYAKVFRPRPQLDLWKSLSSLLENYGIDTTELC